jgi:hypothetical protein
MNIANDWGLRLINTIVRASIMIASTSRCTQGQAPTTAPAAGCKSETGDYHAARYSRRRAERPLSSLFSSLLHVGLRRLPASYNTCSYTFISYYICVDPCKSL